MSAKELRDNSPLAGAPATWSLDDVELEDEDPYDDLFILAALLEEEATSSAFGTPAAPLRSLFLEGG